MRGREPPNSLPVPVHPALPASRVGCKLEERSMDLLARRLTPLRLPPPPHVLRLHPQSALQAVAHCPLSHLVAPPHCTDSPSRAPPAQYHRTRILRAHLVERVGDTCTAARLASLLGCCAVGCTSSATPLVLPRLTGRLNLRSPSAAVSAVPRLRVVRIADMKMQADAMARTSPNRRVSLNLVFSFERLARCVIPMWLMRV